MSDQPQPAGLLDGVEQATPFNMDAFIDQVGATPKQQYDGVHVDPEAGLDTGPAPETRAGVAMGAQAKSATAKALMLMADRAQAGLFAFFGARGRADDFRFNERDRAEMAGYLEEGIPDNFKLPWWVPLAMLFGVSTGANFTKLQEIKAEKRRLEEVEKAKARKVAQEEEQANQRDQQQHEAYRERRDDRPLRNRSKRQPAAPPAPEKAPPTSGLTPELRAAKAQAKANAKAKEQARQERYNERRRAARAAERAKREESATGKGDGGA